MGHWRTVVKMARSGVGVMDFIMPLPSLFPPLGISNGSGGERKLTATSKSANHISTEAIVQMQIDENSPAFSSVHQGLASRNG